MKRGKKSSEKKKGVSVLIGYVLLIVFAIIISIGVYSWLKTYVPAETLSCKDGVSLFVQGSTFDASGTRQLNVTIKNNGRFSVAGFFIHATNSSGQSLATIDLSSHIDSNYEGKQFGSAVLATAVAGNAFEPGDVKTYVFNIPSSLGNIYLLEVIPASFETSNNRERFVSCSDDKVRQQIGEGVTTQGLCTPACGTNEFCDASGNCISNTCTPAVDPTKDAICAGQECGIALNGSCGYVYCGNYSNGGCQTGFYCNSSNMCESTSTCNGVWNTPESNGVECDGGPNCFADCTCPIGYNPDGSGGCVAGSGTYSIDDYCHSLGYTDGRCSTNNGGCVNAGGELVSGGDVYCSPSLGCCIPAR